MIDDLILCERIIEKAPISNRYKTAVIGYFFEGKTYDEVGADLGCGRTRASQIIQKALRLIKRKFNPSPVTYKWLEPIPKKPKEEPISKKPKEEPISKKEYYRLLALEENAWNG